MSEQEKFNRLIEAIRRKASEILPKGSRVSLYGSRARGDAKADSDWDLHVLVPGEEKLSIDKWDEYGWLKRNFLPFYKNVEKEKIIIYQS